MKYKIVLLFTLLSFSSLLFAQENKTKDALMNKLTSILFTQANCDSMMNEVMSNILASDKAAVYYQDLCKEFFTSKYNIDSMKTLYKNTFMDLYNEKEIDALISFYGNPTGQSILRKEAKMTALWDNKIKENVRSGLPDLQTKIEARMKKLKDDANTSPTYVSVTSKDSSFTMQIPSFWEKVADASDEAALSASSILDGYYLACLKMSAAGDDTGTASDPLGLIAQGIEVNFQSITDAIIGQMKQSYDSLAVDKNESVKINGMDAQRVTIKSIANGEKMFQFITIIDCGQEFYFILTSGKDAEPEKSLPKLEKIHNSFKLIKK